MNKEELRRYARAGIRQHLADLEKHLRELQEEFPEEFFTTTPIVLVSAEKKPNGNDWPPFKAVEGNGNGNGRKSGWTAERRAAQAERMRQLQASTTHTTPNRVRAYLQSHPGVGTNELCKALGLTTTSEKGALRKALSDLKKRKEIRHDHNHKWVLRKQPRPGKLGTASGIKMDFWEYLRAHGPSKGTDAAKALKLKSAANVIGSSTEWIRAGIIKRLGKGMYEAGPVDPPPPPVHHEPE